MKESNGVLRTKIISDDENKHVYEICREFDTEGDEIILITLFPTITNPNQCDLSGMHMLNHASDEGLALKKIHFVFLFSSVSSAKMSTKGLKLDKDNMAYLRDIIMKLPDAKIVISFGNSMSRNAAGLESKVELFRIINELRPNEALWQLEADGMNEEAAHMLYAGIRYGDLSWSLSHYLVPYRYTPEGYEAYLKCKEAARERFIQNVLSKKKEDTGRDEKTGKGRKKSENKE